MKKKHHLKAAAKQLSLKALGLHFYLICTDAHISAESLATQLQEGEAAITGALKELRDMELLEMKTIRTPNGQFTKKTRITPSGYKFFAECLTQLDGMSPNLMDFYITLPIEEYANVSKFLSELDRFQRKKTEGNYAILSEEGFKGFSSAEIREMKEESALQTRKERERQRRKNRADFIAHQKHLRAKKKMERDARYRSSWTATDISYEFSDRCQRVWSIPPWEVGQTRFAQTQASFRKRFDTNGEIECQMMDRFFETEDIDKHPDANFLMQRYFYRYSELLSYVKRITYTPEEIESEKSESHKSIAKFKEGLM